MKFMKKATMYAVPLAALITTSTATVAIGGTGGPVDCVAHEGCPTAAYQTETASPVIDWPEFIIEQEAHNEMGPVAGGWQCKVTVECGPKKLA